jgi:hypothetical protein
MNIFEAQEVEVALLSVLKLTMISGLFGIWLRSFIFADLRYKIVFEFFKLLCGGWL